MNLIQIPEGLFIGSYPKDLDDIMRLKEGYGITAVLNVQADEDLRDAGLYWLALEESYRSPEIGSQRVPIKNSLLTPADLTPGSNKKVWWICAKGHKWQAMVNSNRGSGWPYCYGNKVTVETCLKTINPRLSSEWHPTQK